MILNQYQIDTLVCDLRKEGISFISAFKVANELEKLVIEGNCPLRVFNYGAASLIFSARYRKQNGFDCVETVEAASAFQQGLAALELAQGRKPCP